MWMLKDKISLDFLSEKCYTIYKERMGVCVWAYT